VQCGPGRGWHRSCSALGVLQLLVRPASDHVTLKRAVMSGVIAPVLLIALGIPAVCQAQPPPATPAAAPAESSDGSELAKKLSNPISDLASVPFQFNWEQNVGPDKQTRFVLNIQPVVPFALTPNMNLITRIIVPFVSQPPLVADGTAAAGVSHILASFFFSPNSGSSFTWGVGPAISLPSTTEPTLGTEKWSAGPTFVLLKQQGPWTVGALWNQIWSFSGSTARDDVNQMFVQPFLAYTTKTQSRSRFSPRVSGISRRTAISGPFRSTSSCRRFLHLGCSPPAIRSVLAGSSCIPTAGRPGRCEGPLSCCSRSDAKRVTTKDHTDEE
jgi:hypothetical protein